MPPSVGVVTDTPRLVRTLQDMSPRARQPVAAAQRLSITQPELQCKGPEWHVPPRGLACPCQVPTTTAWPAVQPPHIFPCVAPDGSG